MLFGVIGKIDFAVNIRSLLWSSETKALGEETCRALQITDFQKLGFKIVMIAEIPISNHYQAATIK